MPKVSIITPCFNSAKFLESTFSSVMSQSLSDWEWILIDDCSSDNTFEIIKSWANKDQRIKALKNETNSGAAFTRNVGLKNATGEFVAFLDADDLWTQDKLEKQFKFMDSNNLSFSYHDYDIVDSNSTFIKSMNAPAIVEKKLLEQFNPIFTSSVMMKKDSIKEIRFKVELRRRQDYIFWHDMIGVTKVAKNVGMTLGSYRVGNQESLSHNKFRAVKIQWNIYRTEFKLGRMKSTQSLMAYAFHGIKKYFL